MVIYIEEKGERKSLKHKDLRSWKVSFLRLKVSFFGLYIRIASDFKS